MIRVGTHYVEPRRTGFFLGEEAVLWAAFLGGALLLARPVGGASPLLLLACALGVGLALEFALSLADLHDLRVALDDARSGRRLLRVLGALLLVAAPVWWSAWWLAVRSTEAQGTGAGWAQPVLAGLLAACAAVLGTRALLVVAGRDGALSTRVFLVGEGRALRSLVREIQRESAVEVVGFCGPRVEGIATRARSAGASAVVVAADDRRGMPTEELLRCRTAGLEVADAPLFAARALQRLPIELVRPSDLIYGDGFAASAWVRLGRRTLSVAAALLLLLLASPLLLSAALAIRLDSDGPVLFRQQRVGRGGRPFDMLKLRTMRRDAEQAGGAIWARQGDPRVTRVGRWLRRFRIDELPQLVNVLRGDMELVGPRPERPQFVELLREQIPFYDLRHLVPPGISGWAQVRYPYAASVEEAREKLQYDLYYVRHLGVSFDLYILLLTVRTILLGRGAR